MDVTGSETYRSRKLLIDVEETMERSGFNKMVTPRGSIVPRYDRDLQYLSSQLRYSTGNY